MKVQVIRLLVYLLSKLTQLILTSRNKREVLSDKQVDEINKLIQDDKAYWSYDIEEDKLTLNMK